MTITHLKYVLFSIICACIVTISSSAQADDRRQHRYEQRYDQGDGRYSSHQMSYQHIYYPQHRAYFSPHSRTWFWFEGSRWRSGVRLPVAFNMQIGGIPIQLNTATPYYQHHYVERRFPRSHYVITERPHRYDRHHRHHHGNPRNW
jgi:hypothetical protein